MGGTDVLVTNPRLARRCGINVEEMLNQPTPAPAIVWENLMIGQLMPGSVIPVGSGAGIEVVSIAGRNAFSGFWG